MDLESWLLYLSHPYDIPQLKKTAQWEWRLHKRLRKEGDPDPDARSSEADSDRMAVVIKEHLLEALSSSNAYVREWGRLVMGHEQ